MKSTIELNDLFDYQLSIYQDVRYFKFSVDSVLLAEFVRIRKGKTRVLDLCTGNAPIPMILQQKYNNIDITAIELQKEIYDLALASLKINNISSVKLLNADVLELFSKFKGEKFDVITCNPPYFKVLENGFINDNLVKAIARHEVKLNLEGLLESVAKIIQNQGYFYMVHHVTRFTEIVDNLHKYKFGIKRIVFIHDDNTSPASLFLVEAMFNGKDYINVLAPVILKGKSTYKNIFER